MAFFSIGIAIILGLIVITPIFFVKNKWAQFAVVIFAITAAAITNELSDHYLYPAYLGWNFEQDIKKQPLFNLIEKTNPQEYNQFIIKVKKSLRKKEDLNLIAIYSSQLMDRIFYQHLQHAPDESIFLNLKATLDLYRYLNTQNPQVIIKFESGSTSTPIDFNTLWEDKTFQMLLNHLLETKRLIIETAIKTPVTTPEPNATTLMDAVLNQLTVKFGEEFMRLVFSQTLVNVPPNMAANLIISFYSEIVASGKENAGIIMRHIAQIKTKEMEKNANNPAVQNPPLPNPPAQNPPVSPVNTP
jgi:hypothetical protein